MKSEKQSQIYLPSNAKRKIGEALGEILGETLDIPFIDSTALINLQISLEEDNKHSKEIIKHEMSRIERRNYHIEVIKKFLETDNFVEP